MSSNPLAQTLLLYSKSECPLCDQAMEVIHSVVDENVWRVETVDIETDPALMEKYGWYIPVVARADNANELRWPFTPGRVKKLIAQ